jgi:hypothetical protein
VTCLKQKSRPFVVVTLLRDRKTLSRGFAQGLDALGAQHFVYGATLLHHERLLQVRFERAIGGALGE